MQVYDKDTSCLPQLQPITKGFVTYVKALPDYSLDYDFNSIRSLLLQYVSDNYPDYLDYLETNAGNMFIELIAYITSMLAFRSDFLRSQAYVDTVSDKNNLTHLMSLTAQNLRTPSPSYLESHNLLTGLTQITLERATDSIGDVAIQVGSRVPVTLDIGSIVYELFKFDTQTYAPKYTDLFSYTPVYFNVIPKGFRNNSFDISDSYFSDYSFIMVEGVTKIDTFISNGDPDQEFLFSSYPLMTDYAHSNFRTALQIISGLNDSVDNEWFEVDSLIELGPTEKGYELEWDGSFKTKIKFGNNVFGKVPEKGSIIRVLYRVGGTAKKALSQKVSQYIAALDSKSRTNVLLTNQIPTTGGYAGDDLLIAKALYGTRVRRQSRILSGEDFASYAMDFPGIAKAKANLLNNESWGNLVQLRVSEYTSTSEGYYRPVEAYNKGFIKKGTLVNVVTNVYYDDTSQGTIIELLYDLPDGFGARFNSTYPDDITYSDICLVSADGITKRLTIINKRKILIYDEDVTDVFTKSKVIGLTSLNDPRFMLAMYDSAPMSMNVVGVNPNQLFTNQELGNGSEKIIIQIDNEFLEVAATDVDAVNSPSNWITKTGDNSFKTGLIESGERVRYLNILSRGKYGSEVSPHIVDDIAFVQQVREDLYKSIEKYKVAPSEVLITEGQILPFYMYLKIIIDNSNNLTMFYKIKKALEEYFNLFEPRWNFGEPFRLSPFLSVIHAQEGVMSINYQHASQYVILSDLLGSCDDTTPTDKILICEDITNVPETHIVGMLPYAEAINTNLNVVSTDLKKTYLLSEDLQLDSTSITLSKISGSDFSYLPANGGMIKIKDEYIAYRYRINNILYDITRKVYNSGTTDVYKVTDQTKIFLAPNIIIELLHETKK